MTVVKFTGRPPYRKERVTGKIYLMNVNERLRLLVVVPSPPIRLFICRALESRGFHVAECVNALDAVHHMSTEWVPSGFIIDAGPAANSGEGMALVQRLLKLERTATLPIVVSVCTPTQYQHVRTLGVPSHVQPVLARDTDDKMCCEIDTAFRKAASEAGIPLENLPTESHSDNPNAVETAPKPLGGRVVMEEFGDEYSEMDRALAFFEEVTGRVKANDLPGPMVPKLLQQVREVFGDPDIPFSEIQDFVAKHQSLSIQLLSMSNSAHYARGGPRAKTIVQAVRRLGMKPTFSLLQAIAARGFIVGNNTKIQEMTRDCLDRAYFVASAAETMADLTGRVDPTEAYTLGLFHNIGATFFLYAYAMLLDNKAVEKVDYSAITTVVQSKITSLNKLITTVMELPPAINQIHATDAEGKKGRSRRATPAVLLVQQAMWVTSRILDEGARELQCDAEARALEIFDVTLDEFNTKIDSLLSLLEAYRA